jgi:hypothetical protein
MKNLGAITRNDLKQKLQDLSQIDNVFGEESIAKIDLSIVEERKKFNLFIKKTKPTKILNNCQLRPHSDDFKPQPFQLLKMAKT